MFETIDHRIGLNEEERKELNEIRQRQRDAYEAKDAQEDSSPDKDDDFRPAEDEGDKNGCWKNFTEFFSNVTGLKDAICYKKFGCCREPCNRLNVSHTKGALEHNFDTFKDLWFLFTVPVKYEVLRRA